MRLEDYEDKVSVHQAKKAATKDESNMKDQINIVHKMRMQCEQCDDYSAYSKYHLRRHVKAVHDKIRDEACGLCDFRASHKSVIKRHIKAVHDQNRDHACEICSFRTSLKYNLKMHINSVHLNIKPFACEQCNYSTANSMAHLRRHVKVVHDKVKNLACEHCTYKTSNNHALENHIMSEHQESNEIKKAEEGQKCPICHLVVESEEDLTEHLMSIHVS